MAVKKHIKYVICLVIMCFLFVGIKCFFLYDGEIDKDKAIKMGRNILITEYPEIINDEDMQFDAICEDDFWMVYNVIDYEKYLKDNILVLGGGYYVKISKKDGTVLSIGLGD